MAEYPLPHRRRLERPAAEPGSTREHERGKERDVDVVDTNIQV
jgi:hypothetical protein